MLLKIVFTAFVMLQLASVSPVGSKIGIPGPGCYPCGDSGNVR